MKKKFLPTKLLVSASFCLTTIAHAATLTLYTDYDKWLEAVNTSGENLEISTFETDYDHISKEGNNINSHSFQPLPPSSDSHYRTIRTDTSFDGNNVDLGQFATFKSGITGFDISFEIAAIEASGAHIYYNDILHGKTFEQVDHFTNVLSIGKFNGFAAGDRDDWTDDDFTLEITSDHSVYGIGFDLVNNKFNSLESLEVFESKFDIRSLILFDQGSIPGYIGSYEENFDDVRFVGIVSDTPFSWLEFNEGEGPNDIGLANFRFATVTIAPPPPTLERLRINHSGSGSGSFLINPEGIDCGFGSVICRDYTSGTSVTITAISTTRDSFVSWSGCDNTSGQSCTVVMTNFRNIEALFNDIPDADHDGTPDDSDNCPTIANPQQTNSDGDRAGNLCDAFPSDASETKDSDSDGMGDNFEITFALNELNSSDAALDQDADDYTNLQEFQFGTNPTNFHSSPAKVTVLTQIQSMSNEAGSPPKTASFPWLTTTTRNITSKGAEFALERAEVNDGALHSPESVGFLAIQSGRQGQFKSLSGQPVDYQTSQTNPVVIGWGDGCHTISLQKNFLQTPLAFASLITRRGDNGGWLRRCSLGLDHVGLTVDEDRFHDAERNHIGEASSLLVFSRPFAAEFSNIDHNWQMEANTVLLPSTTQGSNPGFKKITLIQRFDVKPVIFALPGKQGGQPAALRIRNVSLDSFEIVQVEPKSEDGRHAPVIIQYLAVTPGVHQLSDGTRLHVDTLQTQKVQHGTGVDGTEGWQHQSFQLVHQARQ